MVLLPNNRSFFKEVTNLEKNILTNAKFVLGAESEAIESLKNTIGDEFVKSVQLILNCKGKLVVTGVGKSANIATKIVATFNSTGQPAVFMHAADAIHGDLGLVSESDIVMCLSKSGNTTEIKNLISHIKISGNQIIAITANPDSFLAKNADILLETKMDKEACPINLAPTVSTTLALAMGDALAVCLMQERNFSKNDFARLHPGGSLGNKLRMKVSAIYPNNPIPYVLTDTSVKDVIIEISKNRLGITAVLDPLKNIVGVITDGDIRRMLNDHDDFSLLKSQDIMSKNPKTIGKDSLGIDALQIMEDNNITQLLVSENSKLEGFVHLHDLLKEGLS